MITINNLVKKYGRVQALDNVSCFIPEETICALVGPNGAGKSTLLKILTRILPYDAGAIEYGTALRNGTFQQNIAYLPEQRGLYTGVDIETQLAFFANIRGLSDRKAQESVSYWLNKLGISSWGKRRVSELSKGMQQKVQFVSSLVGYPAIMFMDEPVMSQYGTSAFITVKREDIVLALKEISDVIKDFKGLSAVHCCGKADWSLLIDAGINIINFDAYAYSKSLSAYSKDMKKFLKNGGYISWGLVPTLDKEALEKITIKELEEKFENAVSDLSKKMDNEISEEQIIKNSFITPSCGAGGLPMNLAKKAMKLVNDLSENLKEKYKI